MRRGRYVAVVSILVAGLAAVLGLPAASGSARLGPGGDGWTGDGRTATPVRHVVVIFQENVSFDHYFGTYPQALNPPGEPRFAARPGTPTVNGLSGALLTSNPNRSNPQRLDRSQALTCGPSNNYTREQTAADAGRMDNFVAGTGGGTTLAQCLASVGDTAPVTGPSPNYDVMDYYDGNTVTALWNYAQHFAISDNSYGTTFGPSTVGALNLVAGNTFGATCGDSGHVYSGGGVPVCPAGPGAAAPGTSRAAGTGTVYGDADPYYDGCSAGSTIAMGGRNVGDLLNARKITWGWFQGGFAPSSRTSSGQPLCAAEHKIINGTEEVDYSAHHEPFQYYPQTANPLHLPPSSVAMIGRTDQANHQYDLSDFWAAAQAGHLPSVSFLKAPRAGDAHSGNSDPLDEQQFLVGTINRLQALPAWRSTAVIIAYDDSNGWYDHQSSPLVTQSQTPVDALTGAGTCGTQASAVPLTGTGQAEQARCGLGPRLPLVVISPYAKANFVDHAVTDQSSILRFIEDNWHLPRLGNGSADAGAGSLTSMFDFRAPRNRPFYLDALTGEPAR
jgi:phospholipase C